MQHEPNQEPDVSKIDKAIATMDLAFSLKPLFSLENNDIEIYRFQTDFWKECILCPKKIHTGVTIVNVKSNQELLFCNTCFKFLKEAFTILTQGE